MPDELPPLDKFVVSGYSSGHPSDPIVIVVKDSRSLGHTAPALYSLCPDDRYATHQFIGITPTNIDNRAIWTYKILPGPIITAPGYDDQTRVGIYTTRQEVVAGTSPPALSTSGTADLIIDAVYEPIDAAYGTMVITYLEDLPPSRVEKQSAGFQFPGIFVALAPWATESVCSISGPFAGVNYTLTRPRSASRPMETTISYSFTEPSLPALWVVTAPGSASRIFPIDANTIHSAIEVICSEGPTTVEDLPASTPSSYSAGDVLTIRAESRPNWKGKIYEKRVSTICETPA
jgi:hypothetical protein